ncbi:hypothetical protein M5689_018515 [Euphorbia peplus]|nr:hypothetical protein M5689_018515 [Euphorbia peplus]
MEVKKVWIRFHHKGHFSKNNYSDGKTKTISTEVDCDCFGFPDLMEYIKDDVGYTEIGGVYVKRQIGGWKLLENDNDLTEFISRFKPHSWLDFYIDNVVDRLIEPMNSSQPHVIIRPRPNFMEAKKLQPKRKCVSLKSAIDQLRAQKEAKGTVLVNQEEMVSEDASDGEDNGVSYEKIREMNIAANNQRMAAFNLPSLTAGLRFPKESKKRQQRVQEDSEGYCPTNGSEHHNADDESDITSKRTKTVQKTIVGTRRTTRSQSNITANANIEKVLTSLNYGQAFDGKTITPSGQTCNKQLQRKRNDGVGSMAAFLALRERQKLAELETAQDKHVAGSSLNQTDDQLDDNREVFLSCLMRNGEAFNEVFHVKTAPPSGTPRKKHVKRQRNEVAGSMSEFLALREQEKDAGKTSLPQVDAQTNDIFRDVPEAKKRKRRGKTKLDIVHTRRFEDRKFIRLNDKFQPVSDKTNTRSEFSLFLGTIARQYVPLDYTDWRKVPGKDNLWEFVKEKYIVPEEGKYWVMKTMKDAWKLYKCHTKALHYTCYATDEERIQNRPDDIPLEEFKVLLKYWSNEKVQVVAAQNAASRMKITDTHTAGPKSFAQIVNEMQLANPNREAPSRADIFVETRKRTEGRDYKSPTEVINYRISTIQDMVSSGANNESVEQLIRGDVAHGPTWLDGRHGRPQISKKHSRENTSDSYVEDLTAKIKYNLEREMEEKMDKRLKETLTLILKKLAKDNPNLKIDLEDIYGGLSSEIEEVSRDQEMEE